MSNSKNLKNINKRVGNKSTSNNSKIQWRVWIGILSVIVMSIMNWQWTWGILFLIWIIPDIISRVTYFMEPVKRDESPFLYWTIVVTWIALSLFSFSSLFIDYNNLGY
ncbi:hypothetical protein [Oceanihabitans sediminis]|uniref:hypothetical protein n=1 Tax=Oceanihabitans sediminis TaxID=1812012 RepID=UPI00299D53AF|nr:hypothetical protein [Oceanihabitans sediminis]MDX1774164.1 hypothetical protein [Oceanihabitans sediminis]